ncbi:hypothetical protein L565_1686 [Bordetella pertussis CHLA-20]|nr:hypothetical protein L565_1686 [Bordetella pertussis CHLA-20]
MPGPAPARPAARPGPPGRRAWRAASARASWRSPRRPAPLPGGGAYSRRRRPRRWPWQARCGRLAARGRAGAILGRRRPQRRADAYRRRLAGILRQQGENGARGLAQRGRRGGRRAGAGLQAAGGQRQRGRGLGVHPRGALARAALAAGLYRLARIARGCLGCAGAGGLAGLGDRVGACAGYQVGLRRHRGAQYGVEPLHQNAAQGGRADTHVPLALPL